MGEDGQPRVVRPSWISHKSGPIYSLDCHPVLPKLLTGGQSEQSAGVVAMWNVRCFLPDDGEGKAAGDEKRDDGKPIRRICAFEFEDCVNVVRWSYDGRRFACAGPAGCVSVYGYVGPLRSAGAVGDDEPPTERWRSEHALRAHSAEVLHVDWSNDGAYLASCSVDNSIIVWDARALPDQVARLTGHKDFVKGLAFDPLSKYLASQSADRTLKVWHARSWRCLHTVDHCFKESVNSSPMCRPGWSPDGRTLVAVNAMNGGAPVAQTVDRLNDWASNRDLVGHRRALIVARFSPRLFLPWSEQSAGEKWPTKPGNLLALAGKDLSLSVWRRVPYVRRPMIVIEELFKTAVFDLSWSASGRTLFACSKQGAVAAVILPRTLGRQLTAGEMADWLRTIYDDKISRSWLACQRERTQADVLVNGHASTPERVGVLEPSPSEPPRPHVPAAVVTTTNGPIASVGAAEKAAPSQPQSAVSSAQSTTVASAQPPPPPTPQKQTETRLKSGKRRIQPIFLGSMEPAAKQPTPAPAAPVTVATAEAQLDRVNSTTVVSSSVGGTLHSQVPSTSALQSQLPAPAGPSGVCPAAIAPIRITLGGGQAGADAVAVPVERLTGALAKNSLRARLPDGRVAVGHDSTHGAVISVEAAGDASAVQPAPVATAWRHSLPGCSVKVLCASRALVAAVLSRSKQALHCLYCWRAKDGCLLAAPVCLPDAPALLRCSDAGHVAVVLENAQCYAIDAMCCCQVLVPFVSLAPLLTGDQQLTECHVTAGGVLVVATSSGARFAYSQPARGWCLLSDDAASECGIETVDGAAEAKRAAGLSLRLQSDVYAAGLAGNEQEFVTAVQRWLAQCVAAGADQCSAFSYWLDRLIEDSVPMPQGVSKRDLITGCRRLCDAAPPSLVSAVDEALSRVEDKCDKPSPVAAADCDVAPAMDCL